MIPKRSQKGKIIVPKDPQTCCLRSLLVTTPVSCDTYHSRCNIWTLSLRNVARAQPFFFSPSLPLMILQSLYSQKERERERGRKNKKATSQKERERNILQI